MSTCSEHHFYQIVISANVDVNTENNIQILKLVINEQWEPLATLRLKEHFNTSREKIVN